MGPMFERAVVPLDGEWQFVPDPGRSLDPERLPHGRSIQVPGCWEADLGRRPIITAWYRREVTIPADWRGSRAVLCFGAVMYHAAVYLNGALLAEHEGGYSPFEVEISAAARWGTQNDLAVRVTNPMNALGRFPAGPEELATADATVPEWPASEIPHGKQTWYSSQSGIWQSVRLERRSRLALAPLRISPDPGRSSAIVRWRLDEPADAPAIDATDLQLVFSIEDPDGQIVAREAHPVDLTRDEISMTIPDVRLWGIGRPTLYRVTALLERGGQPIDAVAARFGMREIRIDGGRIILNGDPIYLLGALDQDLYPETISTPPSRSMLDEQMRRARELGFNLLRCHIKVPDSAYLDAADEAGILVWCELPNWQRFSVEAARRGRDTLRSMIETLGNHPSIVIWTIVNEDWGTRLREEHRDRLWLAETYAWLKELDPTRLVVDNSACDTASAPNFHVRSDLADFHVYHAAPDNAIRWRNRMTEFAGRPRWLWSPHGDAQPRGDEPLVLSEFGTWGLPRPDGLIGGDGRPPWWFETGRGQVVPAGVADRFADQRLDRVWPSVDALADATQRHQFEALQFEIGELRRHRSIQGYVVTELTDAYWEANGLLDVHRGPKVFHEAFGQINAPDVVVVDLPRRDVWVGDRIDAPILLSSFGEPSRGGQVAWQLVGTGGAQAEGQADIQAWPVADTREIGRLGVDLPTAVVGDVRLRVEAVDDEGVRRATNEYRLVVLPRESTDSRRRLRIRVHDPLGVWRVGERVAGLGHEISDADPDLLVGTMLTRDMVRAIDEGASGLVLVRDRAALPRDLDLERPVQVHARELPDGDSPDGRSPWHGDWVTAWSWLLPGMLAGVPTSNPLDFTFGEVIPDHVLGGYDPSAHADEVIAGMFAGWVHAPAALVWSFRQGAGRLTLTTFRLAPEDGPMATVMLDSLLAYAAGKKANREAISETVLADSVGAS